MNYSKDDTEKKEKTHKSKTKKVANKISTLVFRGLVISILVGGFAVVGGGVGIYLAVLEKAPSLAQLEMSVQPDMENSIVYEAKTGREIDRLIGEENRRIVTIDAIPLHLQQAFIAIEDERFYSHSGVDIRGLFRASYETLRGNTQGASTITQQVIKNNVMGIMRNTWETKLQEQYLAINYEKSLIDTLGSKEKAKQHILEIYLNSIGLAHGLSGVQAASLRYFAKDVSELTLSEAAVIAAITQRPEFYSPIRRPENNKVRQTMVLNKMAELGFITELERDRAIADDVYARISDVDLEFTATSSSHDYFVDQLITEIIHDLQERENYSFNMANFILFNGGLQIYATVDTQMQDIVNAAYLDDDLFPAGNDFEIVLTYRATVKNEVTERIREIREERIIKSKEAIEETVFAIKGELLGPDEVATWEVIEPVLQPQSGFVVLDYHTGQVKAISGGRGEKLSSRTLRRATASPRQPGSVFKVLASFAPAIDLGLIMPGTVFDDVPFSVGDWSPSNWYASSGTPYRGLSTVREAIRDSMNVITVENFVETGADNILDYLLNFGFEHLVLEGAKNDRGPSTSLGGITNGTTMLELAASYGAIANGGEYIKPYFYTKVVDSNGVTILENIPEPRQVLKKTTSFLLTNMMQDVITSGTGGRARFREVQMPVAGKTGTTSDVRDLVFAGYTPYYAAAIYLGHDMPKTISNRENMHLTLWRHIMEQFHADLPHKEFERPDGIVTARICRESGQLGLEGLCNHDPRGNTIYTEYFTSGAQPQEYCTVHYSVEIDIESGLLATEFCPPENRQTLVGIIRPVPFNGSEVVGDRQYEIPRNLLGQEVDGFWMEPETCYLHGFGFVNQFEGLDHPLMPDSTHSMESNEADPLMPDFNPDSNSNEVADTPQAPPTGIPEPDWISPPIVIPNNPAPVIPEESEEPEEASDIPIDDFSYVQ